MPLSAPHPPYRIPSITKRAPCGLEFAYQRRLVPHNAKRIGSKVHRVYARARRSITRYPREWRDLVSSCYSQPLPGKFSRAICDAGELSSNLDCWMDPAFWIMGVAGVTVTFSLIWFGKDRPTCRVRPSRTDKVWGLDTNTNDRSPPVPRGSRVSGCRSPDTTLGHRMPSHNFHPSQ